MKKLLWTETAKKDLHQIYDYISEDSVHYANKFVDSLIDKTNKITVFPYKGRIVPEIGDDNTREIYHYSYRIMYKIASEHIYITQISHMSQNFKV